MSTPKKENEKTSDPVLQSSGEVLEEVEEEKKEITLQDVLNRLGGIEERIGGKVDNLMVRMEVMENRMAVLEARWSPKCPRVGTPEPNKTVLVLPEANQEVQTRTVLFGGLGEAGTGTTSETSVLLKTAVVAADASERASLFEDFVSGVLDRKEDMFSEKSFMVNLPKLTSVASVPAHSLVVPLLPMTLEPEGGVDPALMKKPEPPDIGKVMERKLGQHETKRPPRRLVRRESLQGKWGERKR